METKTKKILVVGDVMLDVYVSGVARRLSPEAPCPVLSDCAAPINRLGGAANVAAQLAASGLDVTLWSCIGSDCEGATLRRLASEAGINALLPEIADVATTVKTRYIAEGNHQLLRIDRDCPYSPDSSDYAECVSPLPDVSGFDAVILSDYAKGILTEELCCRLIGECRATGVVSVVDIKAAPFRKYAGATVIKGNHREFDHLFADLGINPADNIADKLRIAADSLGCEYIVMTCGKNGMAGYSVAEGYFNCKADDVAIYDVTGAGDTVTAFLAMLLTDGLRPFGDILRYATVAAQTKVSRTGTATVTYREIVAPRRGKIADAATVEAASGGRRLVFTNGCFDVIHAGHVALLEHARRQGDILVVGLNSDSSVSGLKGPGRPVNRFADRAAVLEAMASVDYIIEFDSPTPEALIRRLRPDVLVKGGDYTISDIVGADFVTARGGEVIIFPLKRGLSSTAILNHPGYE